MSVELSELEELFRGRLDPEQLEAVCAERGALCILAGAGAGKTRVLTHRVAWLTAASDIAPERVLAVSFTNAAVDEMRERLGELMGPEAASEVACATFHAAAWRLIVRPYRRQFARPVSVIYGAEDARSACSRAIAEAGVQRRPGEVLSAIGLAKAQRRSPSQLAAGSAIEREIAAVWFRYREILRASGALDFEDIIAAAVWLLEERAEVREAICGRFAAVLVDEYQDASPLQQRMVELLAGQASISVVGDDDQSLYGFRGGDASALREFTSHYAARGAERMVLGRNYRSGSAIVSAAAALIAHNPDRPPKDLHAQTEGGEAEFRVFGSESAEADGAAAWVRSRLETGVEASEIAVLARTARGLGRIEQLLAAKGVPYRLVGKMRLAEHAEVRDCLALVSAARYPNHTEALMRAARRVPGLGVRGLERALAQAKSEGRKPLEVLADDARLDARITGRSRAGCAELVARVEGVKAGLGRGLRAGVVQSIKRSGWATELVAEEDEGEARRERLRLVCDLAEQLESEGERDAEVLLVRLLLSETTKQEDEGVTLATIHAAKGREWKLVWLIGCNEGTLPHYRALQGSEEDLAAERCVAYVAMTRAREELVASAAETTGRPPRAAEVSRFISEAHLGERV